MSPRDDDDDGEPEGPLGVDEPADLTPPPEEPPSDLPPPDEAPGAIGNGNGNGGEGWALAEEGERRLEGHAGGMAPEQAADITQEIRAVAESRGDDSQVVDLPDLDAPARQPTAPGQPEPVEPLSPDELRDAWPFLDL